MIRKYTFGTPLPTGAVVQSVPVRSGDVPFFSVSRDGKKVIFSLAMTPDEVLAFLRKLVEERRGE